ncbi:MAG: 2-nitropropane dioxygenase, partial [Candidatus Lindowbacteria bacterium]|nr:2-nitropropane dioxygenase [Candidatus Lindowbacteria bacterium]
TSSVNQACLEAGTSDAVRQLLATTKQADVIMAPAADMFEMGVKVQVLKRGTMFAMRGAKLFELYRAHGSIEELPPAELAKLEKTFFRAPIDQVWENTKSYFEATDPAQIENAQADKKHKMALIFRSYLGQASGWANRGVEDRKIDYQIWCGPSMGSFNEWVKGSFLESWENRKVAAVAKNILTGTAITLRAATLRQQGVDFPASAAQFTPQQ